MTRKLSDIETAWLNRMRLRLTTAQLAARLGVTVDQVRDALRGDSQGEATSARPQRSTYPEPPAAFETILHRVARGFGCTPADIRAGRRTPRVTAARAMVVHVARQHTRMSYPEIAAALNTAHSTVIGAHQRCRRALAEQRKQQQEAGA